MSFTLTNMNDECSCGRQAVFDVISISLALSVGASNCITFLSVVHYAVFLIFVMISTFLPFIRLLFFWWTKSGDCVVIVSNFALFRGSSFHHLGFTIGELEYVLYIACFVLSIYSLFLLFLFITSLLIFSCSSKEIRHIMYIDIGK